MISWLSNNLSGQAKRGVGSALTLGLGSLGGVAVSRRRSPCERRWIADSALTAVNQSSNIYRREGAPRYFLGHGTELGLVVLGMFSSCLYAFLLHRSNVAKEAEIARQAALPEHERKVWTVEELQDLGDK